MSNSGNNLAFCPLLITPVPSREPTPPLAFPNGKSPLPVKNTEAISLSSKKHPDP
jgi:hypothetical protein